MIATHERTGTEAESSARRAYIEATVREATEGAKRAYGVSEERAREMVKEIAEEQAERDIHSVETRKLWMESDEPIVCTGQGDQRKTYNGEPAPRAETVGIPLGLLVIVCVGWLVYWILFSGAV